MGSITVGSPGSVPDQPPLSPEEVARRGLAGGARAARAATATLAGSGVAEPAASLVQRWVAVHEGQLALLSAADTPHLLTGRVAPGDGAAPVAAVPGPRTVAQQLAALTGTALSVAPLGAATALTYSRMAAARLAQHSVLANVIGVTPDTPAERYPDTVPVEVLQEILAARHAAVDGYLTAAAWASRDARDTFLGQLAAHERARDALADLVRARDVGPVPAAPGYALPGEVSETLTAGGSPRSDDRAALLAKVVETNLARSVAAAAGALAAAVVPEKGFRLRDRGSAEFAAARQALAAVTADLGAAEAARQRWGGDPLTLPGS